jgi:hypothetical protein
MLIITHISLPSIYCKEGFMQAHSHLTPAFVAVCLFGAFAALRADAQSIPSSFDQLQFLVKPGDTVTVTDTSGRKTTGEITTLSSSLLALQHGGTGQEFAERDISTIYQRHSDSLANGAFWGGLAGAASSGALVGATFESGDSEGRAAAFIATFAGIGAAIGAGIDALFQERKVIYERPSTPGKISIVPMLSRSSRSVLVSMRF